MGATYKEIKIALGLYMSGSDMKQVGLDIDALNDIQDELWFYLCKVIAQAPTVGRFVPCVNWCTKPEEVTNTDLVCYFVKNQSASIIGSLGLPTSGKEAGGFTVIGSRYGTISEVYVENNFPSKKLANIAFHELMHNKLQKDSSELHNQTPGVGMGKSPATECSVLTPTDLLLMSKRLTAAVPQYPDLLPGELSRSQLFLNPKSKAPVAKFFCT
jgi:hypothetical protein